jgi:hypothetical protein
VDPGPSSTVLRSGAETPPPTPPPASANKARERDLEGLMDRFRKEVGRTSAGVIPVDVIVPALGPSFFAAAELTAEMQAPAIDLKYKRSGDK